MPAITLGTVVKLLLLCLVVGAVLTWLGVNPWEFWLWLRDLAVGAVEGANSMLGSVGTYILIGAVVVVPIWLARYLLRALRRRS